MKFTIKASELQSVLEKAVPIIPQRTPLAVLENIELKAENGILSVRTTDQEIKYTGEIKISSDGKASTLIGANFATLIGLTPSDSDVTIEFKPEGLTLKTPKGKYSFTTPIGELPDIGSGFKKTGSFKIKADYLRKLISNTMFAISNDSKMKQFESVYIGINLQGSDGLLKSCGTDGRMFAKSTIELKTDINLILPAKTCKVILGTFTEGDISVSYNDKMVRLENKKTSVESLVIDIQYVDYERIISGFTGTSDLVCDRNEFLGALKRILLFSTGEATALRFTVSKTGILIDVSNAETAMSGSESVSAEYEGEEFQIILNGRFAQNAISQIDSERIRIKFLGSTKPCMIEPETQSDVTFSSVLNCIRG